MKIEFCPHCDANLQGVAIPERCFVHEESCPNYQCEVSGCDIHGHEVGVECFCLPYGDMPLEERFFSRKVGVEIPGIYDGILFWQCPDCLRCWHRFPTGDWRWTEALRYFDLEGNVISVIR